MSEPQETVETRGDDRVDLLATDTNGDGKPDVWVSDTDGDGKADLFQFDTDGDGKVDITMVDLDEDGTPDDDRRRRRRPTAGLTGQPPPSAVRARPQHGDRQHDRGPSAVEPAAATTSRRRAPPGGPGRPGSGARIARRHSSRGNRCTAAQLDSQPGLGALQSAYR